MALLGCAYHTCQAIFKNTQQSYLHLYQTDQIQGLLVGKDKTREDMHVVTNKTKTS